MATTWFNLLEIKDKGMKALILNIILMAFNGSTQSGINEKDLVDFHQYLKTQITKELYEEMPQQIDLITVAYCTVDPSTINNYKLSHFNKSLKIDVSRGYAVVKDGRGNVLGTIEKGENSSFTKIGALPKQEILLIELVEFVKTRYGKNCFLVSLSDIEPTYSVGFFTQNDSVGFLNSDFQVMNVDDMIIKRVGSIEKYLENNKSRQQKAEFLRELSDLNVAKDILKRDFTSYQNTFPTDTTKTFRLLFEEMSKSCGASIDQFELIKKEILVSLKKKTLPEFNGLGVSLYGNDVSFCIKSVLTRSQYEKFMFERERNSWLASQASKSIYMHLFEKRMISPDKIPRALKIEVYGHD
ncbi:MAG: hypothetical protein EBR30_28775 [Cytophagia bacterium]|nr:hypothetical protein [Cytophagia bacterium]